MKPDTNAGLARTEPPQAGRGWRRSLVNPSRLAVTTLMLAWAGPAMTQALQPAGAPSLLINLDQRAQMGIENGPDSITDVWTAPDGTYLLFSGLLEGRRRGTFRVPVDPGLTRITPRLDLVLSPDCGLDPANGPACNRFDSNYAGGGTAYRCPNGGPSLYFYHGENHTPPDGRYRSGSPGNWTGIGMAVWDQPSKHFRKLGQILGLGVSNHWQRTATGYATRQGAASSGNPGVVFNPADTNLYIYYTDLSDDPDIAGGDAACGARVCTAVARAPAAAVCAAAAAGHSYTWSKRFRGGFSEAGVVSDGTGGKFTPLVSRDRKTGENLPNVTYLPATRRFVMIALQRPSGDIIARQSTDGLTWSEPQRILSQPTDGSYITYPRLIVVPGPAGVDSTVLLYVQKDGKRESGTAKLVRQAMAPLRP